jgi:hypothetical protein
MPAHVTLALCLAALAWAGSARAQDNLACGQYREPMAYNACLAQHGPKANGVGQLHCGPQPGRAAPNRVWYGHSRGAPPARYFSPQRVQRAHGRVHMEFPVR